MFIVLKKQKIKGHNLKLSSDTNTSLERHIVDQ